MAGTWTTLNNQPSFNADTMLQLTDGTVMCHEVSSKNWHRLTPDASGSYVNGTWSSLASLPDNSSISNALGGPTNAPLYFASAVLADGTVFTAGGEYNSGNANAETLACQIYDPVADQWTAITPPSGWSNIGDAPSCVLPDGRLLLGNINSTAVALYDPVTQAFTAGASKGDNSSEETFTLLPDGTVLTVQCSNIPNAEKYLSSSNQWVSAGSTPSTLPQACPGFVAEIGPAILLPDGRVFAIGATGNTALYTAPANPSNAGTWSAGPTLTDTSHNTQFPMDAGAALLPNGKVLCVGSPSPPCSYPGPTTFFEYDPSTNAATVVASPTNAGSACYTGRFLLLPTGQVLFSNNSSTVSVYTPDGSPNAAWKPTITACPTDLITGHSYTITGTQLNGLSQAVSYGDDAQMATNYPIVRLTNTGSGNVIYLRTFNHSTMGVATGTTPVTTNIQVPPGTPGGQYDLVVIANGIASDPVVVEVGSRDAFFIIDRSTYGQGEIQALINLNGAPAVIDPALYVVVEGFSAADLSLTAANLNAPPNLPVIPDPVSGVSLQFSGPVVPHDPSLPPTPQRFTFPYRIVFQDTSMFGFSPDIETVGLSASLTAAGTTVHAAGAIELIKNPNPFILHGDTAHGYPWYLSVDIRVFQLKAGQTRFAAHLATAGDPRDVATGFIQQVITNLNASPGSAGTEFDSLPQDEQLSELALSPVDSHGVSVYNFAVARVRYRDIIPASNVRLFFRMWPAQQTNATYDTATAYRSHADGSGHKVPLLGIEGDEIITIPFFAERRVDTTSVSMTTQTDASNVRGAISPDPLGGEVDSYFGCWLDINQPGDLILPSRMVGGNPANIPDGPFTGMGTLVSIQQLVRSEHQCLLAEVAFDPDPIPSNADPSISDKLAQRNLTFINVPNPGALESRRAPQVFEIRPTPGALRPDLRYDELMIDWSSVPGQGHAAIYLPAVGADTVLQLADQMYLSHRLTRLDADTIGCPTDGVAYIPVPQGSGPNFAGLLTVDLPPTIHKGERYSVQVKQITTVPIRGLVVNREQQIGGKAAAMTRDAQEFEKGRFWRRVLGVFRVEIPVGTKTELLGREERLLSILRWIELAIPLESRWYPVFRRYVAQVGGRVHLMGGNPGLIRPSPDGNWQKGTTTEAGEKGGRTGEEWIGRTGKINALFYDRYGDFEGFVLDTEDGERRFFSREQAVEVVAERAWRERLVTTVLAERDDPRRPMEIVLSPPRESYL